jgi:porin
MRKQVFATIAFSVAAMATGSARAEDVATPPPVDLHIGYVADLVRAMPGDARDKSYYLDNLDVTADLDFARLLGWSGGTGHVHLLNNLGGMPNNAAGTLQGVDNIEVASQRLRVFEAWVEQAIGSRSSLRVGLYDLNSEFYSNEAAGLLIAPAFGVGSEIAATGTNGPSIFPSSALAMRFDTKLSGNVYARAAVLNANASTIGDAHGVDFSFDHGALVIGEAGFEKRTKVAAGLWSYTKRQDDLRDLAPDLSPRRRGAHGAYAIVQAPLRRGEGAKLDGFVRVGVSDGKTTAFRGGWQAGVQVARFVPGRPEAQLSFGANQAWLSGRYRANLRDAGVAPKHAESAIELTYADQLLPGFTVQPDVQLIFDPAGERGRRSAKVVSLRLRYER